MNDPLHRRPVDLTSTGIARLQRDRRALLVTVLVAALVCALIAVVQSRSDVPGTASAGGLAVAVDGPAQVDATAAPTLAPDTSAGSAAPQAQAAPITGGDAIGVTTTVPAVGTDAGTGGDLDGGEDTTSGACTLDKMSVRLGDSGASVTCLQQALAAAGFYTGAVSGQFDQATYAAVRDLQNSKELFVDGVVGRETALSLGIWPDEESLVVRTPPPPPGAVDLMGYRLSSVATSGPDAPPLPAGSGSGKRLVYDRAGQRVWAVDGNERVIRSWLVSGSKYSNELPGTHKVYSKSERSTAWNGKAILPKMVRWLQTRIGHIGFHGIPRHVEDGSAYQTDAELGTRLSGGCQRQADLDAAFVWDFADIGTTVVVL